MIRRIELVNFMSHQHTVIDLADGLTVLVGPNNCGKSAVVTALKILAHNDPSTYVKRHGAKECRVLLEVQDDAGTLHQVEWSRKNSPQYRIDGRSYDRLRTAGLPEALFDLLRMPLVSGESGPAFDVHFGEQKSPVFLLDKPPAQTAQFFASSSDATHLVAMQKLHARKVSEARAQLARIDDQMRQTVDELTRLAPVTPLQQELNQLDELAQDTERRQKRADELKRFLTNMKESRLKLSGWQRHRQCLAGLEPPPMLKETGTLADIVQDLPSLKTRIDRLQELKQTLAPLAPPPPWQETRALKQCRDTLAEGTRQVAQLQCQRNIFDALPAPPELKSTQTLRDTLRTWREIDDERVRLEKALRANVDESRRLEEDWKQQRAAQTDCPVCGQMLPDQIGPPAALSRPSEPAESVSDSRPRKRGS